MVHGVTVFRGLYMKALSSSKLRGLFVRVHMRLHGVSHKVLEVLGRQKFEDPF